MDRNTFDANCEIRYVQQWQSACNEYINMNNVVTKVMQSSSS